MNTLALAAIFRNEAPYLKEWIEFHLEMGVSRFYLFDNLSQDASVQTLQPYIEKNIVELTPWPLTHSDILEWNEVQCLAYERALRKAQGKSKWLALLDTDEFLFPAQNESLEHILSDFEPFGGVGVNWQLYGTSSVQIPENGLLIETLCQKLPETAGANHHIKSIIRPERALSCDCPHFVHYKPGYFQVNMDRTPFEGLLSPAVSIERLRINHYILRDEHYFHTQKIPRLQSWWGRPASFWEEKYSGMNQVFDPAIVRFAPSVKKRMGMV